MQIALIGAGNVAWNIAQVLQTSPFQIVQVISQGGSSAQALADEFGIPDHGQAPAELRQDLDLVLIATHDHSVATVAQQFAPHRPSQAIFAHTSGSISLAELAPLGDPIGVFYPMQTFTKGRPTNWREVPLFLEGNADVVNQLWPVAEYLSDRVAELDSVGRLKLHLGAVFASNFSNYMYLLAEQMIEGLGDFDLKMYEGLIREGVDKALSLGPQNAQTGPARRGDQVTMEKHLQLLKGADAELYGTLSARIRALYASED